MIQPGTGDDTAVLQTALNAVHPSGVLQLGPGTFELDDELVVRLDIELVGAGEQLTFLTRADSGSILNVRRATFGLSDVTLSSSFVTDEEQRFPLLQVASSRVTVERVTILSAPGAGAWMEDVGGTVVDSTFTSNGWIGLWVLGDSTLSLVGNTATDNQDGFIFDEQTFVDLARSSW